MLNKILITIKIFHIIIKLTSGALRYVTYFRHTLFWH